MKKVLSSLALLVLMLPVLAQTVQTVINVPRDQWGNTYQSLLYKPAGYDTTTKKYPLIVFAHGKGEGSSTGGMEVLYNNSTAGGPSYFIEHGQWPSSFTNPKDGQAYQFIVLTPRAKGTNWTYSSSNLDYFIRYMVSNYRVDTNMIYITGLSAGGATIVEYAGHGPVGGVPFQGRYKVAAFVPMSQAYGDPAQSIANNIVADSVRAWGFGDAVCDVGALGCDGHGENTLKLVNKINIAKTGFGRFTQYQGGHCCWGNFYKPAYHETINGQSMNIYEWMLNFSRAPITTPMANAGSNQTITLPTSTITLNGSGTAGAGHTIFSYGWTQVSGPNTAVIAAPASASTQVTGLIQGAYVFRLTVTNNIGATAVSNVTVTVNPAPQPGVTRYIKVRLYDGSIPYTTGGWNNWNITANLGSGALQYATGETSGVTVTTNYVTSVADNGATYPVTMCPLEVGRYVSYASQLDATFTITGLDNNKTYNIETYNTRNKIGPFTTEVSIGSVMRAIVTDTNYANRAAFTSLTPTNGTLVITLHRPSNSTYHYINGFQITELGDSSARTVQTVAALKALDGAFEDDVAKAAWQSFPAPFNDFIVLGTKFEKAQEKLTITVTDLSGRILHMSSFSNIPQGVWNQRLDLSGQLTQPGVYLLQVSGSGLARPVTLKLLKGQ